MYINTGRLDTTKDKYNINSMIFQYPLLVLHYNALESKFRILIQNVTSG